jgi:hypothetical protein
MNDPYCPWCSTYHGGPRCWPDTDHFASAMRDDLYCYTCRRIHRVNDVKHRQTQELWQYAQYLWSDGYKPVHVYPTGLACGDCEHMPCHCDTPADLDLAWLPQLADHDTPPIHTLREAA